MTHPDDVTVRAPAELWPRVAALTIHEAATRRHVLRSLRGPLAVAAIALVAGTATITALVMRASAPPAAPQRPVAAAPSLPQVSDLPLGVLLDEDRTLLAALEAARDRTPTDDRLAELAQRLRGVDASLREGRRSYGRGRLSLDARRALGGPISERARIVGEIHVVLGIRPTPPVPPRAPRP